jgi:hypothetical protein
MFGFIQEDNDENDFKTWDTTLQLGEANNSNMVVTANNCWLSLSANESDAHFYDIMINGRSNTLCLRCWKYGWL